MDRIGHSNPTLEKMSHNPTMPTIRPVAATAILLIFPVLAWSQEAAPAPTPEQASAPAPSSAADSATLANNVLLEAVVKLRLRTRIAAKIEQTVDMLNQKFQLTGSYYKDTGHRVRLQLNLDGAKDSESTMLQVCDGKTLYEYQQVVGMKNYTKRDITPILQKLEESGLDDDFKALILNNLGFGGPEALLIGFQSTIGFNQFADKTPEGVPDAVPSYVLGGTWKKRDGLFGPNDRPLPPTAPLPPYVPSNVQIFIAKDTLWPYRIEMIGKAPTDMLNEVQEYDKATGRPIGARRAPPKVEPSRITLLYTLLPESEIKPDEQFVFTIPRGGTQPIDGTDQFLSQLDQMIQIQQNEKRAREAAGEEAETMIKAPPLDLPSPTPAPIGGAPTNPPTPR